MANGMQAGLVLADSKVASYRSALGRVIQSDFKTCYSSSLQAA